MATKILDLINWQYALNSYQFKHFPPYRRRFKKDFRKEIVSDYHSVMLMVWAGFYNDSLKIDLSRGEHMALWPSMLPYRPSDKIMEWTLNKPNPYFVKIGHGYNSCPEICSGDKSYLLSAGGANQGRRSLIMPKPTVLFLDDDAENLKEIFHMYGPGEDFMDWNNTGVYEDFACSRGSRRKTGSTHIGGVAIFFYIRRHISCCLLQKRIRFNGYCQGQFRGGSSTSDSAK